jgi:sortase A
MADTTLHRTGQAGGNGAVAAPELAAAPAPAGPGPARAAATPRPAAQQSPRPVLRSAGVALLLLAGLALGFAGYLYGLSGVQEARVQTVMYQKLQIELGAQVAPLGPVAPGTPVAILNIPSIGVRDQVVVQGTSPQNLALGPGHRRDTPMPGQAGVSQIFGRRATFGAPFARVGQLRPGDLIQVITGQGVCAYTVAAVTTNRQIIHDPAPDRLLLLTATSPVVPSYYVTVDAHLTSTPHPSPGVSPVITSSELPLAGDRGTLALTLTMEWALALALLSGLATLAATRWSPWAAYLAMAPLALAVLWNLYQSLAALLPNLY